jgi:O-acetyl-ADP-ribose deacetylase
MLDKCKSLKNNTKRDRKRLQELTLKEVNYRGCIIKVRKNDITDEPVDAIVNPANSHLGNEGGAARAIEDAGGSVVRNECFDYIQKYGSLPTGKATVTNAGDLPCEKVIHVVGPRCEKGKDDISEEKKLLKSVVKEILKLILKHDFKSVCILAVSTGIFGFPLKECGNIYASQLIKFIDKHEEEMKGREIILCKFVTNLQATTT